MIDATSGGDVKAPDPVQYLTTEERAEVQRKLNFPEEFPSKFWSAVNEKLALEGLSIPASQIQGANFYRPKILVGTMSAINWTSYQDVGITPVTIGDGQWQLQYGWGILQNSSGNLGHLLMAPSINNDTPNDADAIDSVTLQNNASLSNVVAAASFKSYFKIVTLTAPKNTIQMKAKVSDGNFSADRAWLIATKIGN